MLIGRHAEVVQSGLQGFPVRREGMNQAVQGLTVVVIHQGNTPACRQVVQELCGGIPHFIEHLSRRPGIFHGIGSRVVHAARIVQHQHDVGLEGFGAVHLHGHFVQIQRKAVFGDFEAQLGKVLRRPGGNNASHRVTQEKHKAHQERRPAPVQRAFDFHGRPLDAYLQFPGLHTRDTLRAFLVPGLYVQVAVFHVFHHGGPVHGHHDPFRIHHVVSARNKKHASRFCVGIAGKGCYIHNDRRFGILIVMENFEEEIRAQGPYVDHIKFSLNINLSKIQCTYSRIFRPIHIRVGRFGGDHHGQDNRFQTKGYKNDPVLTRQADQQFIIAGTRDGRSRVGHPHFHRTGFARGQGSRSGFNGNDGGILTHRGANGLHRDGPVHALGAHIGEAQFRSRLSHNHATASLGRSRKIDRQFLGTDLEVRNGPFKAEQHHGVMARRFRA